MFSLRLQVDSPEGSAISSHSPETSGSYFFVIFPEFISVFYGRVSPIGAYSDIFQEELLYLDF